MGRCAAVRLGLGSLVRRPVLSTTCTSTGIILRVLRLLLCSPFFELCRVYIIPVRCPKNHICCCQNKGQEEAQEGVMCELELDVPIGRKGILTGLVISGHRTCRIAGGAAVWRWRRLVTWWRWWRSTTWRRRGTSCTVTLFQLLAFQKDSVSSSTRRRVRGGGG